MILPQQDINTQEIDNSEFRDWGRICVATRLEKAVEPNFFVAWSNLIGNGGLRPGDAYLIAKDRTAHQAANDLVRRFLKTDLDTILFIDSDAEFGLMALEELRTFEDGWKFDALQAFYVRRGWPPEAIWFTTSPLGDTVQNFVLNEGTQESAMVGLHFTLIRREILEAQRAAYPEIDDDKFDWFWYPRHGGISEDSAWSQEVRAFGAHLACTTHLKTGHVCRVTTGWETYRQFLQVSGQMDRLRRHTDAVGLLSEYLDETEDIVAAKVIRANEALLAGYEKHGQPKTADELREFYGDADNGYLYELIAWNTSVFYDEIVSGLSELSGVAVFVFGTGIGGEIDRVKEKNAVIGFDVPGALLDFCKWKYREDDNVVFYEGPKDIREIEPPDVPPYDVIVAIDVIEHIAPEAIEATLERLHKFMAPGGLLVAHNNFGEFDKFPMHFDHTEVWEKFIERNNYERYGPYAWQLKGQQNA